MSSDDLISCYALGPQSVTQQGGRESCAATGASLAELDEINNSELPFFATVFDLGMFYCDYIVAIQQIYGHFCCWFVTALEYWVNNAASSECMKVHRNQNTNTFQTDYVACSDQYMPICEAQCKCIA